MSDEIKYLEDLIQTYAIRVVRAKNHLETQKQHLRDEKRQLRLAQQRLTRLQAKA